MVGKKGKNYQADRQQRAEAQGHAAGSRLLGWLEEVWCDWLIEHGEMRRRWPSQVPEVPACCAEGLQHPLRGQGATRVIQEII